ncbi:MAG: ABC transporter substrate-binding protein [Candidatus Hydrogenedentota bacterium]
MKLKALLFILFCILIALSCSKKDKTITSTIRVGILGEPNTLDPAYVKDVTGGRIVSCIFNCLVRTDKDGNIIPDIADTWEINDRGLKYKFILKDNVYFHNNRKLISKDVERTFIRLLKESPRSWVVEDIKGSIDVKTKKVDTISGIQILSDTELIITLSKPFSPFLYKLAMPNASIIPFEEAEKAEIFGRKPVGAGPWIFSEWITGQKVVLVRNKDYFLGVNNHLPNKLEFKFYVSDFSLSCEYQNNALDIIEITRSILPVLSADKNSVIHKTAGLNLYFLGFNCKQPPFTDPEIRRAFSMGIDREAIMKTLYQENAILSNGPIPPGLPGYRENKPWPQYNPDEAKKILAKKRFDFKKEYVLLQTESKEVLGISESVQQYLSNLGIKIKITQRETSSFKENLFQGNYDLFYYSWWADYPDAENFLYPLFHSANIPSGGNPTFYSNPKIDSLIIQAQSTTNKRNAIALYQNIEDKIIEDMPRIFLWHKTILWASKKNVSNFQLYPIFNAEKFEHVALNY